MTTAPEIEKQVATLLDDPEARAARRAAALATLGVAPAEDTPPLRPVLKEHGLTSYPLIALGLLGIADTFQAQAFSILTPDISRALGVSLGAVALSRTVAFLAVILAPLPVAALVQHGRRRAMVCLITASIWSVTTLFTGFVTSFIALLVLLTLDGLSTGSVTALHGPLLADSYPPKARVRIFSGYTAITTIGAIGSPLLISLLAGPLDLTWRGIFLGLGFVSLGMTAVALGLRDPGPGRFDTELLRADERAKLQVSAPAEDSPETQLRFFEAVRRVILIPTVRRLLGGNVALGILLVPFATYQVAFLESRWDLDAAERGVFFSATAAVSVAALLAFGRYAEQRFHQDPAWVVSFAGIALAVSVACIAVAALMPTFFLMFAFFALSGALITILGPGLSVAILSIIDARYRAHAAAIGGIFLAFGSLAGVLLLSGLDKRLGLQAALAALVIPGVIAGLIVRSAKDFIVDDMERLVDTVLESEDIRAVKERGGHLPLMQCRGIDFSYGQLQVLFDVDFTVDEGEMVALLGTNGAGKSTLLKVISGLGLPSKGTVRFTGEEITYLDPERRVHLGLTQVPGGRAVFGQMDVVENLRTFGYTLGRDRKKVESLIEESFAAFPRLHERRHSLAATLSGGEQQMLGLSRALILKPRLLLIDELSLGLAPLVIGQLLEMVRRINAGGTAVVLVEQSVNIALSLVDHAYFMEKGEMRFDGPSQELLHRSDLLRAVFLEGADQAQGR